MSKDNVNQWSTTAASNNDVGGIDIGENCPAANVNNAIRQLMKQIADLVAGTITLDNLEINTATITSLTLGNTLSFTNLAPTGYLTVGSPTGGQQGTGTINAVGLYDDGVKLAATYPWAVTLQWSGAAIVEDGDYVFTAYAPFPGTITGLKRKTGNGSFTANVKIGGASVTGLSAVSVNSSSYSTATASGANTFVAGDEITVTVTSATSDPTDAVLALYGTRTVA